MATKATYNNFKFQGNSRSVAKILAAFGLEQASFELTATGNENTSYVVTATSGEFILRVYRRHKKTTADIAQELALMSYLHGQGLPVPQHFAGQNGQLVQETTIAGQVWQSILMQFQPGEHPTSFSPALLEQMAATQVRMHLASLDYTNQVLGSQRRFAPYLRHQFQKLILDWTNRQGDNTGLVMSFSHLDYTGHNLLVQHEAIVAILDFDDMTYAPLVDCLATTLLYLKSIGTSNQQLRGYLRHYSVERTLTMPERARLAYVFAGRKRTLLPVLVGSR